MPTTQEFAMLVTRRATMTVIAMTVAVALFACSRNDDNTDSVDAPSPLTYPSGVLSDSANVQAIRGLYASTSSGECCWASSNVRFLVAASNAATRLRLDVYEPNIGPFVKQGQKVSFIASDGKVSSTKTLNAGQAILEFELPMGSISNGLLTVQLQIETWFAPKDYKINGDTRHLTLLVRGASAE